MPYDKISVRKKLQTVRNVIGGTVHLLIHPVRSKIRSAIFHSLIFVVV